MISNDLCIWVQLFLVQTWLLVFMLVLFWHVPCSDPLQYHYWRAIIIDAQEGRVFTCCAHANLSAGFT